jgi:hypothetical protein
MPYSIELQNRIRRLLSGRTGVTEKRMFGGVAFLLDGKLVAGIWDRSLIARIGPEAYDVALTEYAVREFDITGRPMRGWVLVDPPGIASDDDIEDWLDRCWAFVSALPPKEPSGSVRKRGVKKSAAKRAVPRAKQKPGKKADDDEP